MIVDLEGLSGTITLKESDVLNSALDFRNSKAGGITLEFGPNIRQSYWLRDITTDANALFIKVGGGSVTIALPQWRWILTRVLDELRFRPIAGWLANLGASSIVYGADYQAATGRGLLHYKDGADYPDKGGRIALEGSVEETVTVPAAGDTIATLPVGFRPEYTLAFAVVAEPNSAANADVVIVEILNTGAIVLRSLLLWTAAINVPIDLSGIEFFAAN